MLHGLLLILLFAFIFIFIAALTALHFVLRAVRKARDAARSAMGMNTGGNASGKGKEQEYANGSTTNHRRTRASSGIIIIDNRSPERANRKIFAKEEGEYVDFKE